MQLTGHVVIFIYSFGALSVDSCAPSSLPISDYAPTLYPQRAPEQRCSVQSECLFPRDQFHQESFYQRMKINATGNRRKATAGDINFMCADWAKYFQGLNSEKGKNRPSMTFKDFAKTFKPQTVFVLPMKFFLCTISPHSPTQHSFIFHRHNRRECVCTDGADGFGSAGLDGFLPQTDRQLRRCGAVLAPQSHGCSCSRTTTPTCGIRRCRCIWRAITWCAFGRWV